MLVLIAKSVFKSIDWLIGCCAAGTLEPFNFRTESEKNRPPPVRWHYAVHILKWQIVLNARRTGGTGTSKSSIHATTQHYYYSIWPSCGCGIALKPIKLIKRCNWRPQTTALIRAHLKRTTDKRQAKDWVCSLFVCTVLCALMPNIFILIKR